MASFETPVPESRIPGPGQREATVWDDLRKRTLIHLAKAYDVYLPNPDGTKKEILPFMLAAEANGVFNKKPIDERAAAMAHYPNNPEMWPEEANVVEIADFEKLRRMAKEKGINSFQKSADELRELLA